MKLPHILAAGLMIAAIGVSADASAQQRGYGYDQEYRGDRDGRYDRNDRGYDQRDDRLDDRSYRQDRGNNGNHYGWRNNRGNGYGWRNSRGRDCRIVYRYQQRVRICR